VCVAAPGGQNDKAAYRKTAIPGLINNLPPGYFIIGDNAYVCSEKLLTPFSGENRNDPSKDTFNYYVSQLRIRIEMAFGLLTTKWRILRSPLQVCVNNVGVLFVSITRLHNYCINTRDNENNNNNNSNNRNNNNNYNNEDDFYNNNNNVLQYYPSDNTVAELQGNSMIRRIIVDKIIELGLSRPAHNLNRNLNRNLSRNLNRNVTTNLNRRTMN
jgi:DDE superfamily endonuclease